MQCDTPEDSINLLEERVEYLEERNEDLISHIERLEETNKFYMRVVKALLDQLTTLRNVEE